LTLVNNTQSLLDRLDILKKLFDVTEDIDLIYLPNQKGDKLKDSCRGRVEGNTIYLFEDNTKKALETLNHEFLHYVLKESRNASIKIHNSDMALVSSVIENYRKVTEKALNDAEEKGVERLGKGLSRLLNSKRL
jgi:uncharacterized protein YjgD (DUF1641 family)